MAPSPRHKRSAPRHSRLAHVVQTYAALARVVHTCAAVARVVLACVAAVASASVALAQAPAPPPAQAPAGAPAPGAPEPGAPEPGAPEPDQAQRPGSPADSDRIEQRALPGASTERRLAVWAGHAESDNIARTEVAPMDGSYDSVGIVLGLGHDSSRIVARIDGDLEYRNYSDDIDSETLGTLDAMARFDIVQNRFSWLFSDHYGQGLSDAFAPVGPNNRDTINTLSSGPRLDLPVGARTSLELRGEYSRRRYDLATVNDSDATLYELGLLRDVSATAQVGFIGNTNKIDYTNATTPPYQIDSFNLRYQRTLATGRVLAEAGKNEISSGSSKNDEPTYRFEWRRSLTARSDLSITAWRAYMDSGSVLGTATAGSTIGSNPSDIFVTPNPFQQRRLDASYALRLSRTFVGFGVGAFKEAYVGAPDLDNDGTTSQVTASHDVSPRLSVGLGYYWTKHDFTDPATTRPQDKDATTNAWVSRTLARKFSVAFGLSRYRRSGSQTLEENRYEIRLGYSPTGSSTAAMRTIGR